MTTHQNQFLYIQTNDIREGQNAVLGYNRNDDGKARASTMTPMASSAHMTTTPR